MDVCGYNHLPSIISTEEIDFILAIIKIALLDDGLFISKSGVIHCMYTGYLRLTRIAETWYEDFYLNEDKLSFLQSYFELMRKHSILRKRCNVYDLLINL